MRIIILYILVCFSIFGCGVASQHLEVVRPFLEKIDSLENEKEKIEAKNKLTSNDKDRIDYINEEIIRLTDEANAASREYADHNRESYETDNFYNGGNAVEVLFGDSP